MKGSVVGQLMCSCVYLNLSLFRSLHFPRGRPLRSVNLRQRQRFSLADERVGVEGVCYKWGRRVFLSHGSIEQASLHFVCADGELHCQARISGVNCYFQMESNVVPRFYELSPFFFHGTFDPVTDCINIRYGCGDKAVGKDVGLTQTPQNRTKVRKTVQRLGRGKQPQ